MRLQRFVWLMGRILFYVFLFLTLLVVVASLAQEFWRAALVAVIILILTIYKGLICLKIPANSVVVRDGKVVFFIPETTVRNRFDFVTRGQSIVELPDYQLLDRPFKVEIFSPGIGNQVFACRLSLRLGYLMQPTAWQRAYDSFIEHQDAMPVSVRKLLLERCAGLILKPVSITGEASNQEYLTPIIGELDLALESFGLEVVDVRCSYHEGASFARFVTAEQEIVEKGRAEIIYRWHIRDEEGFQNGKWKLLGVAGDNIQ